MPKASYPITNFTGGELSPRLAFRVDTAKYRNGLAECTNGIVMPHGGVRKRPGTRYVFEVKSSAQAQELVPFEFNTEQAYMLEFGPNYIRFYRDQGIIVTGSPKTITAITKANPGVVTTSAAHGYSNGMQVVITGVAGMTEVNGRRFTVANVTSDTFELSGVNTSGYTTYASGGSVDTPVEVTTTYGSSEIASLQFAQSNDTLYIFHPAHPIRKLTRTSHTAWTLSAADIKNGPFRTINSDDTHYLSVAVTGSASVTAITKAEPAVVTTSAAHGFEEGATVTFSSVGGMTEVNGNEYIARNVTATTFELWSEWFEKIDSTSFTTYTSGGTVATSVTAFGTISPGSQVTLTSTDALFDSDHVGALFRLWEPGKATGVSAIPTDNTAVSAGFQVTNDGKVYGGLNNTTFAAWYAEFNPPIHEQGVVTVAKLAGTPSWDMVYLHDTSCILEIESYASATSVTARVVRNHIPKSVVDNDTAVWEEGAWNTHRGYPGAGTFHEKRLWAGGSTSEPQKLWASRIDAFEDFEDGAEGDDAVTVSLAANTVEQIRWLYPADELFAGTASSIRVVKPSGSSGGITPDNVDGNGRVKYGTAPFNPIVIGDVLLFGQRRGLTTNPAHKLRAVVYSFETDSYPAADQTIVSEHITKPGIVDITYQADPDSLIWAARSDGVMACQTYEREQEVAAWHKHTWAGTSAQVKNARVIPGTGGDELWLIVQRSINGATKKYIEVMTSGLTDDMAGEDAIYLDSALTYDSTPTATISGLWHLVGETVDCLVDGAKQMGKTVSATGTISLDPAGSVVHVGKRISMAVETLDLEAGAASGTAKGKNKRISKLYPEVYRSLGGRIGPDADTMTDIEYRTPASVFGQAPSLYTGIIDFPDFEGGWEREARIRFEHDEPYPFTLLGITADINTQG
jgi:hypothetical protein